MTFDPTWPPSHANASSDRFREQFNGLSDKIDAVTGGTAIIHGRIISDGGDVALATSDPNGPTETSMAISASVISGTPVPKIRGKAGGAVAYDIDLDFAGVLEGGGTNSTQEGDRLFFDSNAQRWAPERSIGSQFTDLAALGLAVSDPPTQSEVQTIADRLDEILFRLQQL